MIYVATSFELYCLPKFKAGNIWSPYCRGVMVAQRQMKRTRATERDIISAPWRYTAERHSAHIIGKPRKLVPPMYRSKRGINKKGKMAQDAFCTVTARRH